MSTNEIKTAVLDSAAEQLRGLLESNYDAIRKAASDSFVDDESQAEPVAQVFLRSGHRFRSPKTVSRGSDP